MTEFFSRMDGGQLIGLVAVVGGLLCGIFGIMGHFWREGRLIALKQDLVNRGVSVDEIRDVVNAGTGHDLAAMRLKRSCRG